MKHYTLNLMCKRKLGFCENPELPLNLQDPESGASKVHGKTEACQKEILTEIRLQEPLRQNYMMLLDSDFDAEGNLHCGEPCSTQPFCPFHSACGRPVSLRGATIQQGYTHHKHDCSRCKAMTDQGLHPWTTRGHISSLVPVR